MESNCAWLLVSMCISTLYMEHFTAYGMKAGCLMWSVTSPHYTRLLYNQGWLEEVGTTGDVVVRQCARHSTLARVDIALYS